MDVGFDEGGGGGGGGGDGEPHSIVVNVCDAGSGGLCLVAEVFSVEKEVFCMVSVHVGEDAVDDFFR